MVKLYLQWSLNVTTTDFCLNATRIDVSYELPTTSEVTNIRQNLFVSTSNLGRLIHENALWYNAYKNGVILFCQSVRIPIPLFLSHVAFLCSSSEFRGMISFRFRKTAKLIDMIVRNYVYKLHSPSSKNSIENKPALKWLCFSSQVSCDHMTYNIDRF